MNRFIALALMFWCVSAMAQYANKMQPAKNIDQKIVDKGVMEIDVPLPLPVTGSIAIQNSKQGRAAERVGEDNTESTDKALVHWTKWLVYVTGGLAAGTVLLAVFTLLLWLSTFCMSKRQAHEMKVALKISRVSANAAKKSAEVAERALTTLERPYIFIWGISPIMYGTLHKLDATYDRQQLLYFNIGNFGRTPAVISYLAMGACVLDASQEPFEPLSEIEFDPPPIPRVFSAGEKCEKMWCVVPSGIKTVSKTAGYLIPDLVEGQRLVFSIVVEYSGVSTIEKRKVLAHWQYDVQFDKFRLLLGTES